MAARPLAGACPCQRRGKPALPDHDGLGRELARLSPACRRVGLARGLAAMDLTPLYVVVGAAAAGFVQGLSGFAFGLVASAIWAWVVAPQLAGPMVVFGSLIGQVLSIGTVRRSFDLKRVLPFVVAGLLGIPIGVVLLKNIDQTIFRLVIGIILLVYCSAMLLLRNFGPVKAGGAFADGAVGFVGGVMGGVAGLSGPAPTLWCALPGWKKDVQPAG